MNKKIKKRIKRTAHAFFISGAACTFIYGTLVLTAAKSMLKMQSKPVDY